VGFEPTILWTRDPPALIGGRLEQGIIHRWEWTGGQLVEQGSVSLGLHARLLFPPLLSPSNVPMIYSEPTGNFANAVTALALWSAERRAILFEHLDPEVREPRATPHFYWGRTSLDGSDGNTKIRVRPQAPVR
jgi:hypothetical protein